MLDREAKSGHDVRRFAQIDFEFVIKAIRVQLFRLQSDDHIVVRLRSGGRFDAVPYGPGYIATGVTVSLHFSRRRTKKISSPHCPFHDRSKGDAH
jgi:hypothetical protein